MRRNLVEFLGPLVLVVLVVLVGPTIIDYWRRRRAT